MPIDHDTALILPHCTPRESRCRSNHLQQVCRHNLLQNGALNHEYSMPCLLKA